MADPMYVSPPASKGGYDKMKVPGNKKGMLIPGTTAGSSVWVPGEEDQQGTAGGAGAAPAVAPVASAVMPMAQPRRDPSLIAQNPANRAYRTPWGGPGLAGAGTRQVGRSMRGNPERRVEIAERQAVMRGDMEGAAKFAGMRLESKQQAEGLAFAREREDNRWNQQKEMFGLEQAAQTERDRAQNDQANQMWEKNNQAAKERDATNFAQQQQMFQMHEAARQKSEEADAWKRQQEIMGLRNPPDQTGVPDATAPSFNAGMSPRAPAAPAGLPPGLADLPPLPAPPGMSPMSGGSWRPGAGGAPLPPGTPALPMMPEYQARQEGGFDFLVQNGPNGSRPLQFRPSEKPAPRPLDNAELARLDAAGYEPTGQWLPNGQPQIRRKAPAMDTVTTTTDPYGKSTTARTMKVPQGTPAKTSTYNPFK